MYICGAVINVNTLMAVNIFYIMKHIMNANQKIQNIVNTIMLMQITLHYSGVLNNAHQIQSTVLRVV